VLNQKKSNIQARIVYLSYRFLSGHPTPKSSVNKVCCQKITQNNAGNNFALKNIQFGLLIYGPLCVADLAKVLNLYSAINPCAEGC
jgi:hypothetical protein